MKKNRIRLRESQLHKVIREAINSAINNQTEGTDDIMDAIIMIKEAYVDIQDYLKKDKNAMYELSPALGNLRGAIKILSTKNPTL